MPFADPNLKLVLSQVRNKGQELLGIVVHGLPGQYPTHVCPQAPIARRVWITFFVRVLMVDPMRAYPRDRSAFERQRAAGRQEILHPLWRLIAPMREQAVVAHADAEAPGDPPQKNSQGQTLPGKKEQSGDCADMKCQHEESRRPIHRL